MDIDLTFPGGKRIDAHFGAHVLHTDQPVDLGGEDTAPAPFDLFLASLATCAGIYALGFCQSRGLPTEGLRVHQHVEDDPVTHVPSHITISVSPPTGFPEKYREALLRTVGRCKVKKAIAAQPMFDVELLDEESVECATA